MSLKRKIALSGGVLLLLAVLLFGLLSAAYFYLPFYLESKIIPRLAAQAGLSDFAVKVRNIGFYGADLGTLRIGAQENPAMIIRSVQVDYTPRSLSRHKVEKITMSGIELHALIADGQFKLRGVDIEKIMAAAQSQGETTPGSSQTSPVISLARLEIRDSRINIEYNGQYYMMPFQFDIVPQDAEFNSINVAALVYPRGEKIAINLRLNRPLRKAALNIDSGALDLDRFTDITSRLADVTMSGEMTLQGTADLQWAPVRLSAVNASLALRDAKINTVAFNFKNAQNSQNQNKPLRIDLIQKNDDEWRISGRHITMVAPTPVTLSEFNGTIKKEAKTFAGTGNFTAVLNPSNQPGLNSLPIKIQGPLPLRGQFAVQYHQTGQWHCDITDHPPAPATARKVSLFFEPYKITSSLPEFKLSANAGAQHIDAEYWMKIPAVRVASASESIQLPQLLLKGEAQIASGAKHTAGVTFDLRAPNADLKLKGADIKISEFSISGKLNRGDDRLIALDGVMQVVGAGGKFSNLNIRFNKAGGKIPFQWPLVGKSAQGRFSIANLKYKGMNLGGLTTFIRQTPAGFAFQGRHHSTLMPRTTLAFTGESRLFHAGPAETRIHVDLRRPGRAADIKLGKLFPAAAGVQLYGKLQLSGDVTINSGGYSGNLKADFANGSLLADQYKLAIEGLRMSLSLPELPKLRSAPGQQIYFNKIAMGDIVAHKGRIDFQIESARSILIEKMHFIWCEGNVETQAIRISPGIEDYRLTFHCDRLSLAKVLEQFGAAAASGRGSVNGRIPLQYTQGKIRFEDGFLFSTPGEGGKIHLTGTDILTAGIPPNTNQYVQMELAKEALKDYDYAWAKLNITSEGEELLLQMQMDGKPAKTLPFVYRKDIGGFMKVEANAKGSKFQGIRLDVNFRLPLDKLMQYKELIEMIK